MKFLSFPQPQGLIFFLNRINLDYNDSNYMHSRKLIELRILMRFRSSSFFCIFIKVTPPPPLVLGRGGGEMFFPLPEDKFKGAEILEIY